MAEKGDANAQVSLGYFYYLDADNVEAVKWYRLAADQGLAEAQFGLGLMYSEYFYGDGVPQDYAEAVKWFRLAADQGHLYAQHNLGNMYYESKGVPINYVTAYAWFNVAAVSGYEEAINNRSLVEGRMTPAQIAEAQQLSTEIFERIQQGN